MDDATVSASYLLRLVGLFGVAIGIAWAVQTLCFGDCSVAGRVAWVAASAAMSGAGAGLVVAASRCDVWSTVRGSVRAALP